MVPNSEYFPVGNLNLHVKFWWLIGLNSIIWQCLNPVSPFYLIVEDIDRKFDSPILFRL